MAALRIHEHRIHREGIALPLEPFPARTPCQIGRLPPLQHQPFHGACISLRQMRGRLLPPAGQFLPVSKGHQRRQVNARRGLCDQESLEPRPPLLKRQGAQVFSIVHQKIIGPDGGRKLLHKFGRCRLAVQPLLQLGKGLHRTIAQDQQLPVDTALEGQALQHIGKGGGNVIAGAGVQPRHTPARRISPG